MAKKPTKKDAKKPKEKGNGKGGLIKKIAIIAVVVIVLLGGTGAGLYFMGVFDSHHGIDEVEIVKEVPKEELPLAAPVYHDLPEFVADLRIDTDSRPPFLKLQITVQVAESDLPIVVEKEPKIIDRIQRLLRDQTRLDITGAEGAEKLRSDIVIIMNHALEPSQVHNVLFKQMVLQ